MRLTIGDDTFALMQSKREDMLCSGRGTKVEGLEGTVRGTLLLEHVHNRYMSCFLCYTHSTFKCMYFARGFKITCAVIGISFGGLQLSQRCRQLLLQSDCHHLWLCRAIREV